MFFNNGRFINIFLSFDSCKLSRHLWHDSSFGKKQKIKKSPQRVECLCEALISNQHLQREIRYVQDGFL